MKVKYIGPKVKIIAHGILFVRDTPTEVKFNIGRRVARNRYFEEVAEEAKPLPKMTKQELKTKLSESGVSFPSDAKKSDLMRLNSGD